MLPPSQTLVIYANQMRDHYTKRRRPDTVTPGGKSWLARFGLAGFLFFLGKGLLWLAAPALLVQGCAT